MWFPAVGSYGIATRIHIATHVGLEVLREGGNVFDAAIATSAVLSLVIPHTGGLGGDGFILGQLSNGELVAYNGSGRAPRDFPADKFMEERPKRGGLTISVPGLVDLWIHIWEEYGSMDLKRLLQPAISLAENGFYPPRQLIAAVNRLWDELSPYESWRRTYGAVSKAQPLRQRRHAWVLRQIARKGWEGFYSGRVAEEIVEELGREGAHLSTQDLEEHRGEPMEPMKIEYNGYEVYELPPNTQGVTTLEILRFMDILELDNRQRDGEWWRLYFEAAAHAYSDRDNYLGDPDHMSINPYTLLEERHVSSHISSFRLGGGDTTFFTLADRYGNRLGFIQSLFHPFGSGLVALEIPFQNRLIGFRPEPGYPNSPAPLKRPLHTLSILLYRGDNDLGIVGCAGGDLRPQIHTQVFSNIVDRGMDIGRAVMEPRAMLMSWGSERRIVSETEIGIGEERIPYPATYVGVVQVLRSRDGYIEVFADARGGGTAQAL